MNLWLRSSHRTRNRSETDQSLRHDAVEGMSAMMRMSDSLYEAYASLCTQSP